jgi:hypothetical protein
MIEVCLGIAPVMQPSPHINPGGDCFACATAAGINHLFPDRPLSVEEAENLYKTEEGTLSNHWAGYRSALYNAVTAGYQIEIVADMITPQFDPQQWSYPWWSVRPEAEYARRLEGWLRGGWVALTEIRLDGHGPFDEHGRAYSIDHAVLVDGIRMGWEPISELSSTVREYVHVVCSRKGAYWIALRDFLHNHGAAAWWLFRVDNR